MIYLKRSTSEGPPPFLRLPLVSSGRFKVLQHGGPLPEGRLGEECRHFKLVKVIPEWETEDGCSAEALYAEV